MGSSDLIPYRYPAKPCITMLHLLFLTLQDHVVYFALPDRLPVDLMRHVVLSPSQASAHSFMASSRPGPWHNSVIEHANVSYHATQRARNVPVDRVLSASTEDINTHLRVFLPSPGTASRSIARAIDIHTN